jgi:hypothetical protein
MGAPLREEDPPLVPPTDDSWTARLERWFRGKQGALGPSKARPPIRHCLASWTRPSPSCRPASRNARTTEARLARLGRSSKARRSPGHALGISRDPLARLRRSLFERFRPLLLTVAILAVVGGILFAAVEIVRWRDQRKLHAPSS